MMGRESYEEDIIKDNKEIAEDIEKFNPSDIVVYSRDWTIETIQAQIKGGNIDLNPKFQRRNAWTDDKRSQLIESVIIGYPIPEIVLAEDPNKKKSFIVIDGKQRLLTIAGFMEHNDFEYWNRPVLKGLQVREDLNGRTYDMLKTEPHLSDELREFQNSSLRCTVITNFNHNDVLYDIFYRLNSGSVPLSTQELRQVLNRGEFSNFLIDITNQKQPIHDVLNLDGPDKRLRDIEIMLRLFTFHYFPTHYNGNLKKFLDDKMDELNREWTSKESTIKADYEKINSIIEFLSSIFGDPKKVGRKATSGELEKRFNRVLFEVQIFYFLRLDISNLSNTDQFLQGFIKLCSDDAEFRSSIESSTKNTESYKIRYSKFQELINNSFNLNTQLNPFV